MEIIVTIHAQSGRVVQSCITITALHRITQRDPKQVVTMRAVSAISANKAGPKTQRVLLSGHQPQQPAEHRAAQGDHGTRSRVAALPSQIRHNRSRSAAEKPQSGTARSTNLQLVIKITGSCELVICSSQ